jgi:hypothetical protein
LLQELAQSYTPLRQHSNKAGRALADENLSTPGSSSTNITAAFPASGPAPAQAFQESPELVADAGQGENLADTATQQEGGSGNKTAIIILCIMIALAIIMVVILLLVMRRRAAQIRALKAAARSERQVIRRVS